MSTLIKIKNITKDYQNGDMTTNVLKGISFKINDSEFVAIMGSSGSGKSTLMYLLGFLNTPTSGEYYFEGHNTLKLDDDKLAEFRSEVENEEKEGVLSACLLAGKLVGDSL